MNSQPMQQARQMMFDTQRNAVCTRCYHEEDYSGTSRRHRSNQKSVIFTRGNFAESYLQSPGHNKFEASRYNQGAFTELPIDLHIDLGNYCNLTCKHCEPKASSGIASQYVKWGDATAQQYIGSDWTRNETAWKNTLVEIASIKKLRNVHFMGGETLITPRFVEFVDYMIQQQRFDLNFSFVTNGTRFDLELMEKLSKFNRVGIEVSIETTTAHNAYQRQGTDTDQVLKHLSQYQAMCTDNITITVRPAISILTIGYYPSLLEFCLEQHLLIKSLMVIDPVFLDARLLPTEVKQLYRQQYTDLLHKYELSHSIDHDYNGSNPHQADTVIKNQIVQCLNLLDTPEQPDQDFRLSQLITHCQQWDRVHGLDARLLYPEFKSILDKYGYV